ncbi:hypothetical protein [Ilumatobacter coccineus]|uniref:Zinc finger CGNR domain-containing protein n=1 Tax=Ilumatobacter coccineus (strain NBRC 103263 / KCTC 29153 / YM16-304) TaxID=1313172 RepID=A0A6C7E9M9_ILUCY|nr:hypothetical protein [Ilumatobacter coccineus]BAN04364.1 hypothetical protein YM304_40500 [Ilumatobacter coccineus YM16-304]
MTRRISAARRPDPGHRDSGLDPDLLVDDHVDDDGAEVDPDRLSVCAYWRCGELFERRTANQRYCRKACRSRQNKWQRAVERRRLRSGG